MTSDPTPSDYGRVAGNTPSLSKGERLVVLPRGISALDCKEEFHEPRAPRNPLLLFRSCVADDLFDIKPVADGIYAAIAKPAYKVNCNAAIIILDDGVPVADTHPSLGGPRAHRASKLTPKPVKFVVNTHFHWDHYQGNEAYPSSGLASRSSLQRRLAQVSSSAASRA
jgi:hypothetical protein